ncbi:hypothetical protein EZV62_003877 [Acer yangbiense]|uniref:Uncharacterized protein n=1 Tax=Acer yangbiense TaxID=1000413 RepID=A0A5C7IJW5_9ROSI|nr:hypothetical protein EZV62_003877 [Acer yangbiense]
MPPPAVTVLLSPSMPRLCLDRFSLVDDAAWSDCSSSSMPRQVFDFQESYGGVVKELGDCWSRAGELIAQISKLVERWLVYIEDRDNKAKAILEGLTMAVELGCFSLCVEYDTLGVMDLCNETSFTCADVDNIVFDILSMNSKCINVKSVHGVHELEGRL